MGCQKNVENAFIDANEIDDVDVNLETGEVSIEAKTTFSFDQLQSIITNAGLHYSVRLNGGASRTFQFRLSDSAKTKPFAGFKPIMDRRKREADVFYNSLQSKTLSNEHLQIQRQALAGMLWSKQLYYYNVRQWFKGDPTHPIVRKNERNSHWQHMDNFDVMSMPDKWEYPWYAVWDTAFHCLPLAVLDPSYAKRQLKLITREWYMNPIGHCLIFAHNRNFSIRLQAIDPMALNFSTPSVQPPWRIRKPK